jgi:lipopolysaccharide/colanic/teichoic acid biosynthesis glycosyltransferase
MSTTTPESVLLSERLARIAGLHTAGANQTLPAETYFHVAPATPATLVKRTIDVIGASLGLIMLAPVMGAIALLVRWDSAGPALFRQLRLGHGGRPFYVLKFRTMVTDAETRLKDLEAKNEAAGVLFKMRDDPRVTPLGRFLRRTSLDELPQLFNVLRGDMSLVGPRPLQLRDSRLLEIQDPQAFAVRLSVPPGVTGPWQVSGRSEASDNMVQLDLDYVEHWSLARDLKILVQTFPAVLSSRGAC